MDSGPQGEERGLTWIRVAKKASKWSRELELHNIRTFLLWLFGDTHDCACTGFTCENERPNIEDQNNLISFTVNTLYGSTESVVQDSFTSSLMQLLQCFMKLPLNEIHKAYKHLLY